MGTCNLKLSCVNTMRYACICNDGLVKAVLRENNHAQYSCPSEVRYGTESTVRVVKT